MRKVDDGKKEKKRKKKRKEKKREKNGVFSGHYVIASSLPPERQRPNDDRWNAAHSCQNQDKPHFYSDEAFQRLYLWSPQHAFYAGYFHIDLE